MYDVLQNARKEGDLPADQLVTELMGSGYGSKDIFSTIRSKPFEAWPSELLTFKNNYLQLPGWMSTYKMGAGRSFFLSHMEGILGMLGLVSLPYCYAAADGAEVLVRTGRLVDEATRRLKETARLVLDVMQRDGLNGDDETAVRTLFQVRLIHAYVRHGLLASGWDVEKFGIPVNQEDMAGTNLAFGLIPVRALRRAGHTVDQSGFESYMHVWQVIGYLMGVRADLNPKSVKDAQLLDQAISSRNFRSSEAGQALTSALIQSLCEQVPDQVNERQVQGMMRWLLGDETADLLGIEGSLKEMESTLLSWRNRLNASGRGSEMKLLELKRQLDEEGIRLSLN